MYLARFSTDDEAWIQVAVLIDSTLSFGTARFSAFWDAATSHFSALARISRSTVARRITVDCSRRLRQVVVVTAPAGEEPAVMQAVATLTRLEGIVGEGLKTARTAAEHDQWLEPQGRFRFCSTAGFSVRGVPLACDFRVAPMLDDLIARACVGGYGFSYQLHAREISVGADVLRAVRKNVLLLEEMPGVRLPLIEWQDRLARELSHAVALTEEYVVVDSHAARDAVRSLLADRFDRQYGSLGFEVPAMTLTVGDFEENLRTAVHSHELLPLSPTELCGAAVGSRDLDQLLGWRHSARVAELLATRTGPETPSRRRTVRFLGASHPRSQLDLGREVKHIQENLGRSRARARVHLVQRWAVTIDSLMQALLDVSPEIVHFSGHGSRDGIILLDEAGEEQVVPGEELSKLFRLFSGTIRCVVLNSCFSEQQGHAIRRHIPHVVGIRDEVADDSAVAFSTGFYKAIAAGRDIPFAFELGKTRIALPSLEGEELLILL